MTKIHYNRKESLQLLFGIFIGHLLYKTMDLLIDYFTK